MRKGWRTTPSLDAYLGLALKYNILVRRLLLCMPRTYMYRGFGPSGGHDGVSVRAMPEKLVLQSASSIYRVRMYPKRCRRVRCRLVKLLTTLSVQVCCIIRNTCPLPFSLITHHGKWSRASNLSSIWFRLRKKYILLLGKTKLGGGAAPINQLVKQIGQAM